MKPDRQNSVISFVISKWLLPELTELKNDCACVTGDPVGGAVGAKISTWATHFEWKTLESLDFAVKFQLVFRYETVVFRRYVLSLLVVVLLRKVEAYLIYLSLIWGKFLQRFSCFQKFRHFSYMFPGFPARISDMRSRFSALSLCPQSDPRAKSRFLPQARRIEGSGDENASCPCSSRLHVLVLFYS